MYRPSFQELADFQKKESIVTDYEETLKGVVYMVNINNKPMFCYSTTLHTSCMEVHLMITEEGAKKYPMTLLKTTKDMIHKAFEIYDTYNTMVIDIMPWDKKWAKTLGFKKAPNCDNLESIEGYSNYMLRREDI